MVDKYQITLRSGAGRGRAWPVPETALRIGRDLDCDIIIDNASVSRHHCLISRDDDRLCVRDLESRNGTLVNGHPVVEALLSVGDEISIGEISFMVTGEQILPVAKDEAAAGGSTTRIQFADAQKAMGADGSAVQGFPQNVTDLARLFRLCRECCMSESLGALLRVIDADVRERLKPRRYWLARTLPNDQLEPIAWYGVQSSRSDKEFPEAAVRSMLDSGKPAMSVLDGDGPGTYRRCLMLAPLRSRGGAMGVLAVEGEELARPYEDCDLEYLGALAYAIAPFLVIEEHRRGLEAEVVRYRSERQRSMRMVGGSDAIKRLQYLAQLVAKSDQPILILGETGTGKELIAKHIHEQSNRARGPFVPVNCAAIHADLFESEVFGHEKGAFTGAIGRKTGLLEQSDGGTLFLDEIGDLSAAHQARILRAIETRKFRRVGGESDITADFRVLAATNKELSQEVAEGRFREDLYHRLKGLELRIPPLRMRTEDIPALAESFLDEARMQANKPIEGFTEEAMAYLGQCSWPGNVRELRNCIHTAAILAQGMQIEVELLRELQPAHPTQTGAPLSLADMERQHIIATLSKCGGRVTAAAEMLGIGRSTLYEKLAEYGINR